MLSTSNQATVMVIFGSASGLFANLRRLAIPLAVGRCGGVAMMTAMMAPLLLAITGLSVDVGYWYQQQESLQSAADAGALAAANGALAYSISASNAPSFASTTGENFAVEAANWATNNQFSLASSGLSKITVSAGSSGSAVTFTSVATIPRGSFFSGVKGMGLAGLVGGAQSTSATVGYVTTKSSPCLYVYSTISVSGGSKIDAAGCSIYAGSSTSQSISASGSSQVIGVGGIQTPSSSVTASGSSYIGTNANGGSSDDTSTVTTSAPQESDPLSSMGSAPPWPLMPSLPNPPGGVSSSYTPSLGYNNWNQPGVGDCTQLGGNYSGDCEVYPNYLTGMNNINVNELVMNQGTSNGQTYITGGFGGLSNTTTTLNGNSYYIAGGLNYQSGSSFTFNAGTSTTTCGSWTTTACFIVSGGTQLSNGSFTFGNTSSRGIYYLWGNTNGSSAVNGSALTLNTPSLTMGNGIYYINGGAVFSGSNTVASFGQGTYFFYGYNNNIYGLIDNNASITFAGGNYYFYGGINVSGNGRVTFGPGIYYIYGGSLNISGSGAVIANGATFVLENGANYNLSGGGSLNLNAPTSNCVSYSSYPESSYSASFPYDGTNGEGICGIAIYQQSGDSSTDYVSNGTHGTISGSIYSPSAELNLSDAGSLTFNSSGNLVSLDVYSIVANNGGSITINSSNGSSGSSGSSGGSYAALLVQ